MKKILILILIVLLGTLCYNVVTSGYEIAGIKVLSINDIQNENENLDSTIAKIEELKTVKYPAKISEMNTAAKTMLSNKKTYEELAAYSSEQEVLSASQTEKYDIEVLWVRIGNHAEKCGVIPKLEILSSSNNTTDANDLRITATGGYIGITDFVRAIEDDSKLGFTIENFELVPTTVGNGSELQATFKIRDIFLNPDTTTSTTTNMNVEDENITDKNEKTTNTTENNAKSVENTSGNKITNEI